MIMEVWFKFWTNLSELGLADFMFGATFDGFDDKVPVLGFFPPVVDILALLEDLGDFLQLPIHAFDLQGYFNGALVHIVEVQI